MPATTKPAAADAMPQVVLDALAAAEAAARREAEVAAAISEWRTQAQLALRDGKLREAADQAARATALAGLLPSVPTPPNVHEAEARRTLAEAVMSRLTTLSREGPTLQHMVWRSGQARQLSYNPMWEPNLGSDERIAEDVIAGFRYELQTLDRRAQAWTAAGGFALPGFVAEGQALLSAIAELESRMPKVHAAVKKQLAVPYPGGLTREMLAGSGWFWRGDAVDGRWFYEPPTFAPPPRPLAFGPQTTVAYPGRPAV